jgi:hypothetical protein
VDVEAPTVTHTPFSFTVAPSEHAGNGLDPQGPSAIIIAADPSKKAN